MATLTVDNMADAGVDLSLGAVAAGGDEFANNGNTFVEIRNSSGANAYTVTFVTSGQFKGHALADNAVAIAVSEEKVIGPFDKEVYNDANGRVQVTYAGSAPATDLTIQVFKLKD